jgi:P-loop Domain of unknown function (DUF2791)
MTPMTPLAARAVIRALRAGTAPARHAELVNVGQHELIDRLETFLGQLAVGERLPPMFIEGEWGTGKSQALSMARSIAAAWDLPAAEVCFGARSAPLSHPNRIYPIVSATLKLRDANGLRAVLNRLLAVEGMLPVLAAFAAKRNDLFGRAMRGILRARADDALLLDQHESWTVLMGGDLTRSDTPSRREEAVSRLGALSHMLSACGYGGLLVLGDEIESIALLWNTVSRAGAYNTLGAMMELDRVGWIFGAAGRFAKTVASDLDAGMRGSRRLRPSGLRFLDAWRGQEFVREGLRAFDGDDGRLLAERLKELHATGYGTALKGCELDSVIRAWAEDPARNPRRLTRALMEELDSLRPLGG